MDFEADETAVGTAATTISTKKKKVKGKTIRLGAELAAAQMGSNVIEAEDTLAMIKNALKSGSPSEQIDPVKKVKKAVKKKEKMPKLEDNSGEEDPTQDMTAAGEDFQLMGELEESTDATNKRAGGKKAKKAKKAKKKVKEAPDSISRFFNDYGESPHLQAIEMSYLRYLEAQHAKQSHLKAVKKMQILRALKTIQRFWKQKYQIIRN